MGQARPMLNLNSWVGGFPARAPGEQPPLIRPRSIPEITEEMLRRAAPGLILELRESFQNEWVQWQEPGVSRDPLVSAHRESQAEVWEMIAILLGLPEHAGGGYR